MKNKIFKLLFIFFIALVCFCIFLYFYAGKKAKKIEFGVTFSKPYAEYLGLNWKEVYVSAQNDLNIKYWRIPAYWNIVEPVEGKFDFTDLDFMLEEASKHNSKVLLSIGKRLPRWPECHEPLWLEGLSKTALENKLMSYLETVVRRYQNHPAVFMWQVENEAFLANFGECDKPNKILLKKEIALVEKLDPSRQILITDSGELSLWLKAGSVGDVFGTTMYRYVYSDVFNRYWMNYVPSWFYRVRAGFVKLLNSNKEVIIAELQAEPWTRLNIKKTSIEEQFKTMDIKKFENMLKVAKSTGFSPQYLWGVEWWYFLEKQGHSEFLEKVKSLTK